MTDAAAVSRGRRWLSSQGLNLFSVIGLNALPEALVAAAQEHRVDLGRYARLVMLGHGGRALWRRLAAAGLAGDDPVDDYSVRCATRFVEDWLGGCDFLILYPGKVPIPLQQLGEMAGWHHGSPLGIGVNETYGPWFGYRAVLLVEAAIPVSARRDGPSPCAACSDKPCVAACPARALSAGAPPNVSACSAFRLGQSSPCASRCLARLACPAGAGHRYGGDQLDYFYGRSLDAIRKHQRRR